MSARSTIRELVRTYLLTDSNDKAYSDARLNVLIQNEINMLASDIYEANPDFQRSLTTLTGASHEYEMPTDFRKWVEVRLVDKDGQLLTEVRDDELNNVVGYAFSIVGPDHAATLRTSSACPSDTDIYLKYNAWESDMTSDSDEPSVIPKKFHDVIALRTARVVFGLGGEQVFPAVLEEQVADRYAQLIQHVSRRGVEAMSVRNSVSGV